MSVSYTDKTSCPTACPLKGDGGCYATYGPAGVQWQRLTQGNIGYPWRLFLKALDNLPEGSEFRHNIAGDLPGDGKWINSDAFMELLWACRRRQLRGYTFTHYAPVRNNWQLIQLANTQERGLTVNMSANNIAHADMLKSFDIGPVVTLIPEDAPESFITPAGNRVVTCPQVTRADRLTNCADCMLCQWNKRKCIIGFPVHGTKKKQARQVAMGR
jgi:hypothetical protein